MVRKSQNFRAGITFPIAKIKRSIKKKLIKKRVRKTVPVYLAAVMEYLCAEIMDLAADVAKTCKRKRITPRHVFLAIANDAELNGMLKKVIIPQGGVRPNLLLQLLPKNSKKTKVSTVVAATPKPVIIKAKPIRKPVVKNIRKYHLPNQRQSMKKSVTSSDPNSVSVVYETKLFLGQKLIVLKGDLLQVHCEAIVNPTNANFYMGGQIGQSLQRAGGDEFKSIIAQLKRDHGSLTQCDAVISPSCKTCSKFIIHSYGPTLRDADISSKLSKTLQSCLKTADDKGLKSVALPLIGTGRGGLSEDMAAEVLVKTVLDYFVSVASTSLTSIYFVLKDDSSTNLVVNKLCAMKI